MFTRLRIFSLSIITGTAVGVSGCASIDGIPAHRGDTQTQSTPATSEVPAITGAAETDAQSQPKAAAEDDAQSVSSAAHGTIEAGTSGQQRGLEQTADDDLWRHLRRNFSLTYSRADDPLLAKFEKWYARYPKYFRRISRRAYWYLPYILEQVEARGMPVEIALLPIVESAYNAEAVSPSNAVGMWQFISATGKRFGLRQDWWMDGRRDLVHSTRAALDYLELLAGEFNGDWELALAAYNAGEGTIHKAIRRNRAADKPATYPYLELRRETREYVPRLFAIRNIILAPDSHGITLASVPSKQTLAIVDARTQTDLAVAASLIAMAPGEIAKFNHGYKRRVTPPGGPHTIVVPAEYATRLLNELGKLNHNERLQWARHRVRKGEYLGRIAHKHGVTVKSIMQANQLTTHLIRPGQELKIPISSGHYQYARAGISDVRAQDRKRVYRVRQGDTLWRISQAAGVSLDDLLKWNQLSRSSIIKPGQKLITGKP